MTRQVGIAVALVCAAGLAVPAAAQTEMRIGFVTINDGQNALADKFKEEVEKRSKGAIKGSVFPAAQLGKIPRQIENLKIGAQAVFISPPGFLSGLNTGFQAPDAPGIFKNFWHAHNALTDPKFREPYLKLAESQGILGITIANNGPSSIAAIKPIRTLDDMKGLKARVLATKMESKMASVLGMTGVPMPYSEVLPALQQRTLDACISNVAVMAPSKFYTAAKYITLTDAGMIPSVLWISKRWLAKLPKDQQAMILKLGPELDHWWGHQTLAFVEKGKKTWKDGGGEVIMLPAKDQAEMIKRLEPLGDEFLGADPKTKVLYGLFRDALKRASDQPPKI
jgi:TRAP-type C4-dicarboxylate transport system substrate-binding protein